MKVDAFHISFMTCYVYLGGQIVNNKAYREAIIINDPPQFHYYQLCGIKR